ncbi:MAG: RidA family protein [Deltaproteobacteria bacterium]|nr:RidA family protein [Deltaproteobacteria bacterium]
MTKTIITTDRAPQPVGPYSQAVRADGWLYVSGQIPIDPATGILVDESFEKQVRTVLDTITAILEAAGSGLGQVVKVTIFLTDMERFAELNAIYTEYFSESRPARACVEVSRLPRDATVEIEAIALCS